ncbi:hypothetical protein J6590_100628 [Homalodisca vitripennis]|nr:hypothetical protein J6590_035723 [Homalodisca vitripennis]KAG8333921.1 hypothetical protein J6590_100628 [Homalodisca vitripennis]
MFVLTEFEVSTMLFRTSNIEQDIVYCTQYHEDSDKRYLLWRGLISVAAHLPRYHSPPPPTLPSGSDRVTVRIIRRGDTTL